MQTNFPKGSEKFVTCLVPLNCTEITSIKFVSLTLVLRHFVILTGELLSSFNLLTFNQLYILICQSDLHVVHVRVWIKLALCHMHVNYSLPGSHNFENGCNVAQT